MRLVAPALACLALLAALGCGYRPARDVVAGSGAFAVAAGESHVPDPLALGETMEGARAALAREGALGEGGGTLIISVMTLDEGSSGIVDRGGAPLARGSVLVLTARARLERGEIRVDVGEVTQSLAVSSERAADVDTWRRDDAVRELARRVGRELAARAIAKSAENPYAGAVAPTGPQ